MDETKSHTINLLRPLANAFNLSYVAFGADITDSKAPVYGSLTLSDAFEVEPLKPAPITPTDGTAPFELLSGTIKATFNSHRGIEGDDNIIVTPGVMPCNTGEYRPSYSPCACTGMMGTRYEVLLEAYASYLPIWTRSRRIPKCWATRSQ